MWQMDRQTDRQTWKQYTQFAGGYKYQSSLYFDKMLFWILDYLS